MLQAVSKTKFKPKLMFALLLKEKISAASYSLRVIREQSYKQQEMRS